MNHACVTLDEVLVAATARAAAIVSETAGYLTLALGDATSRAPCAIEERAVTVSTEGTVTITKRGAVRTPEQAAKALRAILARLIAVGTGTAMPSLAAAARPRDESPRGVDAVVQEIEAALIPVNRAAARRALARLARETLKARESGKLVRAVPASSPERAPAPIAPRAEVAASEGAAITMGASAETSMADAAPRATPPGLEAPAIVVEAPALREPAFEIELATAPVVERRTLSGVAGPAPVAMGDAPKPRALTPSVQPAVAALPSSPVVEHARVAPPLPLIAVVTPAPPGVTPSDAPAIERTPTLLGIAPVEMSDDAQTLVDARTAAVIESTPAPAPSPTGLAAVMALPTEDPTTAFALAESPRPLPIVASLKTETASAPRAAPAAVRAGCVQPVVDARPTRADDLLARFGASCVDDSSMLATAARLRRMAGIEATPPPAPMEASPSAPASRASEAPPLDAWTPGAGRESQHQVSWAPPPRLTRRSGWGTASALVVVLAAIAGGTLAVRFDAEVLGAVTKGRDAVAGALGLSMGPAASPPRASMPGQTAAASTATPAPMAPPTTSTTTVPVERAAPTRAERGTTQRQR